MELGRARRQLTKIAERENRARYVATVEWLIEDLQDLINGETDQDDDTDNEEDDE